MANFGKQSALHQDSEDCEGYNAQHQSKLYFFNGSQSYYYGKDKNKLCSYNQATKVMKFISLLKRSKKKFQFNNLKLL